MSTAYQDANSIMESNNLVIEQFFDGQASCDYFDGLCYRLILDTLIHELHIQIDVEDSLIDESFVEIDRVYGCCDTPFDERYDESKDREDFGYIEWLGQIEDKIRTALEAA